MEATAKKMIGLIISAVLLLSAAGLGTLFYFGAQPAYADDLLTGDRLDLVLNGGNNPLIFNNLQNKAPGDSGDSYAVLKNAGNLPGTLSVQVSQVINIGGNGGSEFEDGCGDLGDVAEIAPWIDLDRNGVFDSGSDIALSADCRTLTTGLQWSTVNSFGGKDWNEALNRMDADQENRFYISWRIPSSAGNNIQGDSFNLSLSFTLKQPASGAMVMNGEVIQAAY